jgi:hypothetical protein
LVLSMLRLLSSLPVLRSDRSLWWLTSLIRLLKVVPIAGALLSFGSSGLGRDGDDGRRCLSFSLSFSFGFEERGLL